MTVGPVQPTLGWAATPTGLSTTTRSSSSWMTVMPGTGSATTASAGAASGSGRATSSQAPATTRSDLPTAFWSRVTAPSAARSAALVRDRPKSRARAASTRSPSRPSGTGSARTSDIALCPAGGVPGLALRGALPVDADAAQGEQGDQDGRGHHRRVGDVEDRPVRQLQEVHDVPAAGPGRAHHPVGEVAQRAAEQQAEGPGPPPAAEAAAGGHDDRDDAAGHQG